VTSSSLFSPNLPGVFVFDVYVFHDLKIENEAKRPKTGPKKEKERPLP
jgi:hypothetical protein